MDPCVRACAVCALACSTFLSLQDLACAVLGNLLCDPEAAARAETAGEAAGLDLLDGSAADKLLVGFVSHCCCCCCCCCCCTSYGIALHDEACNQTTTAVVEPQ